MQKLVSFLLIVMVAAPHPASAQHEGHDMAAMARDSANSMHVEAQVIPLFTRASPSAGGAERSQFAFAQAFLMLRSTAGKGRFAFDATLNAEGLTMPGGELNTGASGEGFVDKRHPHTYAHELMASWLGVAGPLRLSVSAGRGFAAFGTDDPMMRPIEKYPLDHHLSQILERAVVTATARSGFVMVEGSTFNGDEPTGPETLPRMTRVGDSWSVRGTILPTVFSELQWSYARVASPEQRSGFGLDQRKLSFSGRFVSPNRRLYGLASWARTREHDHSRNLDVFAYDAVLAEGSIRIAWGMIALRLEQTDRPEEERLSDPFRTPRPASDLSIGGITRWRVATLHIEAPAATRTFISGTPFIEVGRLKASPTDERSLLTPQRLYGTSDFWMMSAGVRIRGGGGHERMGRYGVAQP